MGECECVGEFKCEVECDGKVMIKGIIIIGEVCIVRNNVIFVM